MKLRPALLLLGIVPLGLLLGLMGGMAVKPQMSMPEREERGSAPARSSITTADQLRRAREDRADLDTGFGFDADADDPYGDGQWDNGESEFSDPDPFSGNLADPATQESAPPAEGLASAPPPSSGRAAPDTGPRIIVPAPAPPPRFEPPPQPAPRTPPPPADPDSSLPGIW